MAERADLLIELGCEELPPGALDSLAAAFADEVAQGLADAGLREENGGVTVFATPRRMAVRVAAVAGRQPDQVLERRGPALDVAFDDDGQPTAAAKGFARSIGLEVDQLQTLETDQGRWLYAEVDKPGEAIDTLLWPIVETAMKRMPVPRPMRWGDHDAGFVRPLHWLVALHGERVVPGEVLGRAAGRATRGHRVHAPGPHALERAADYEEVLEAACVVADPAERRRRIVASAEAVAGNDARLDVPAALLDEVANLVEWPVALACDFDPEFLDVPAEALVASMQEHQRFFPLHDADGALLPRFVAIANLDSTDSDQVRTGYERVIRPRLADARFFWRQDLQRPLESQLQALDKVVFQKQLGTIGDKTRRVTDISDQIAKFLEIDRGLVERAAVLSRCDLATLMVGEFPGLQGVMGRHYALAAGEPGAVADALDQYYEPRQSGDPIPEGPVARVVGLADRLDTLVGIFAAGLKPSGSKDPFALRRAATGLVRILIEARLPLELDRLLAIAANQVSERVTVEPETLGEVRRFVLERVRTLYRERGLAAGLIRAGLAAPLSTLADLDARLDALAGFLATEDGRRLAAANKRIGNIIDKAGSEDFGEVNAKSLQLEEENALFSAVSDAESRLVPARDTRRYEQALGVLADLGEPVDRFFDAVMVMDENPELQRNRLALLQRLKAHFDNIADLAEVG